MIYKKIWKYILTKDDSIACNSVYFYRPKAVKDFSNVSKGNIGGFIDGYHNLSQKGNCWIYHTASVYGEAYISEDAKILDKARIYGDSVVYGNTVVGGDAMIYGKSKINTGMIYNAEVFDSKIFGNSYIGKVRVIKSILVTDNYIMNYDVINKQIIEE